uniref:Uncharacterized protein n=2 Tax=Knipowitschia caucasica TaxID=637954 RepID=A0AAV2J211_KNICA
MLCALSIWLVSANPLHRFSREAPWAESRSNQAHVKTEASKSMDSSYKSHIDSSSLYIQEAKHQVAAEVQHKLSLESERLRVRLHQELAELREKLSPPPSHISSSVRDLRERLAPLVMQLQTSLTSNTQELCVQVRLYLQSIEAAAPSAPDGQTLQQKILQRIGLTLDLSSSKMADIIQDFDSEASKVMGNFKDLEPARSEVWQKFSSRLSQEVGSLQMEAQSRVEMLLEELSSLQTSSQGFEDGMSPKMERFCLNAVLQNQLFSAIMERLFVDLGEQLAATESAQTPASSSPHGGSLQGDFSHELSSLLQDIVHSVQ